MKVVEHKTSGLEEKCLRVYEDLKMHSKSQPFVAKDYAERQGVKEVNIRMLIRELRLRGIRICSDPSHKGYWLEEKGGGYEQTRNQMLSRAYRLLEVVKAMDNCKDGQYEWESVNG